MRKLHQIKSRATELKQKCNTLKTTKAIENTKDQIRDELFNFAQELHRLSQNSHKVKLVGAWYHDMGNYGVIDGEYHIFDVTLDSIYIESEDKSGHFKSVKIPLFDNTCGVDNLTRIEFISKI